MTDLELMQLKVADELENRLLSEDDNVSKQEAAELEHYMHFSEMYQLITDVYFRRFNEAKAVVDKAFSRRVKKISEWRMEG